MGNATWIPQQNKIQCNICSKNIHQLKKDANICKVSNGNIFWDNDNKIFEDILWIEYMHKGSIITAGIYKKNNQKYIHCDSQKKRLYKFSQKTFYHTTIAL